MFGSSGLELPYKVKTLIVHGIVPETERLCDRCYDHYTPSTAAPDSQKLAKIVPMSSIQNLSAVRGPHLGKGFTNQPRG